MTVYEVSYRQDDAPNGIALLFFKSKREAVQAAARIRREHEETARAYQAALDGAVEYYSLPVTPGETPCPEVDKLTFTGTCREMVLQALRHARL